MNHAISTRILSLVLALVMVIGLVPVDVWAAEAETVSTEPVLIEEAGSETTEAAVETTEAAAETTEAAVETTEVTEEAAEATEEATEATEEATEAIEEATEATEEATEATEETTVETEATEETLPEIAEEAAFEDEAYYNVLSEKVYNLAPGATETEMVLNNDAGTRRQIVHVFEVDPTNENIEVIPGYYQIDKLDPDNLADRTYWKAMPLTTTVAYYEDVLGLNVVGAMNTALAYDCDAPYDFMVWNGVVLADPANHTGNAQTYLAVYKDGTCEVRSRTEALDGNEWNVIAANFGFIVKDGELVTKTETREGDVASRSMIGIKEDGTLVFCQTDGRMGTSVATGLNNYEMGEMMLSLGCVNAVNCDGGGSSTFVSKREGTSANVMRSIPSDGSERATINSVMIVSTAKATGEFDHANVTTAYDYIAPSASMAVSAEGIDAAGGAAEIPADITWQLSDASCGTIADGIFTAAADKIDVSVAIQMVWNGQVVGEKAVTIVHPASFGFADESTVIPYGKSIDLEIEALYGADNWDVCIDGVYTFSLSDDTAATLSGDTLTASTDESKSGVDVTAIYTPDPTKTGTLAVAFGKGSEVIFDFENGEHQDFMGVDEAIAWCEENGITGTIFSDGNFSDDADNYTFLATEANGGQVKHGEKSLGVTLDYTDAQFASWSYNMFFYTGEGKVLRDTANGQNATTYGAWVYIPEGAAGLAMQLTCAVAKVEGGTPATTQIHFYFNTVNGDKKLLNAATEAEIPESRWVYATADLTAYSYVALLDGTEDGALSRHPSYIRFYIKPTKPAMLTFYYDDFTLDYSSAVEDRILPTISNVCYATEDTSVSLSEGATISGNSIAFSAHVADNAAIKASTGRILVDGISVGATVSGSTMSCGNVTLTSGVHTVTFEIQDALGNLAKVTRTFTIAGDAAITLAGRNESGAPAEYDSVYYADINVADITAIDSLTATVKLQSANDWEPEGISVAPGFKYSYSLNEKSYELTVTVERNGEAVNAEETTLISLPIRVWSWHGSNHVTGDEITPEAQFKTGYCPIVTVDCEIVYGKAVYANDTFGAFGGAFSAETNLNDNINPWHTHTEYALSDKAATCTENGYAGRTYCDGCASVIEWGAILAATGHTFEMTEGVVKCACGELFTGEWTDGITYVDGVVIADGWNGDSYYVSGKKLTGIQLIEDSYYQFDENGISQGKYTGLFEMGGYTYYAISGNLMGGWQMIDNNWYHFNVSTYTGYNGTYSQAYFGLNEALEYTFENGKLVSGVWVQSGEGVRYYYGPSFYYGSWQTIGEDRYYFQDNGYPCTGYCAITANKNDPTAEYRMYLFDETGKLLETLTTTGIVDTGSASYYLEEGVVSKIGLVKVDGAYYYFSTSNGVMYKNGTRYIADDCISESASNIPAGTYTFGADGKMEYVEPDAPVEPEKKNGIVGDYYYVNDVIQKVGLIKVDGAYYYFSTTNGVMYKNGTRYVAQDCITHESVQHMVCGTYTFGEDGKMVYEEVPEEEAKNGIFGDYYYENDVIVKVGLVKVDGDVYYFSTTDGTMNRNKTRYVAQDCITHESVQGMKAGEYTFGADGKMVVEVDETKEGIVGDYYYENGVIVKVGLVKVDGGVYYFSTTDGKMNRNKTRYVAQDCITHESVQGMTAGMYTFGADGKMVVEEPEEEVKNGIVGDYYYVDGEIQKVGLIKVDGAYYYFSTTNGVMYKSGTRYVAQDCITHESVQGMSANVYTFGADGKMVVEEEKNGIVGNYYYVDGVIAKVGLIQVDGDYYYFSTTNGVMYKDGTRYVAQDCITHESVQGMKAGMYTFGADGKMVV